jgi:hypothetical protein
VLGGCIRYVYASGCVHVSVCASVCGMHMLSGRGVHLCAHRMCASMQHMYDWRMGVGLYTGVCDTYSLAAHIASRMCRLRAGFGMYSSLSRSLSLLNSSLCLRYVLVYLTVTSLHCPLSTADSPAYFGRSQRTRCRHPRSITVHCCLCSHGVQHCGEGGRVRSDGARRQGSRG